MTRLTKRVIDSVELRDKPYFVWCSDLTGFGVRVFPTGRRVYYVDYRNQSGARKRMTLGPHGKLTTEEARKLAIKALGDALKGEDPAEERATRRKSMTVSQLCDRYMEAAEAGLIHGKRGLPKKASTIATDRGRIARHIKPLMGGKLVTDVTRSDVSRFIRDLTVGKTATDERTGPRGRSRVTGGPGTAARTSGLLGSILTYAVSEGIISHNPALGVRRPAYRARDRRLSPEEYRRLGIALTDLRSEVETPQAVFGTWLLSLSGCRFSEVVWLRWDEVDAAGGCFRLAETKEGKSVRPIGRPVFDVLAGIPRAGDLVLPSVRGDCAYIGLKGALRRITARAELDGVSAHTLRHSYASVAGDLGFSEIVIKALLGHSGGSVTSRYVHHLDSVLVAAADKVARAVHGQLTGQEGVVVQMPVSR